MATRRTLMAGKIEIRKSGEKFLFVVLNRNGEKLLQTGQFDDKPSTKRAASSLAKAVSGSEIVDATKPAAATAKSSARRPKIKRYLPAAHNGPPVSAHYRHPRRAPSRLTLVERR